MAETLFDHADGGEALTIFDEGVNSGIEMADFCESVYQGPYGGRDDVSLWTGKAGE